LRRRSGSRWDTAAIPDFRRRFVSLSKFHW
jgi:hypothetical protein